MQAHDASLLRELSYAGKTHCEVLPGSTNCMNHWLEKSLYLQTKCFLMLSKEGSACSLEKKQLGFEITQT